MINVLNLGFKTVLIAGLLANSIAIPAAQMKDAQGRDSKHGAMPPAVSSPAAAPAATSVSTPSMPARDLRSTGADNLYRAFWGIEDIHVRETASGSLIRFSYRVVDAAKANVLNDAKLNPILINASTGEKLEIPETENTGKLRQVAKPQIGREYWMVFLNNSRFVRPGSRVNIVIGGFHADGLVVEPSMSTVAPKKP